MAVQGSSTLGDGTPVDIPVNQARADGAEDFAPVPLAEEQAPASDQLDNEPYEHSDSSPSATAPIDVPTPPSTDSLGYPADVDEAFKDVLGVFKEKNIKFADVEMLLHETITSGDMNKLDTAAMDALLGSSSALVRMALQGALTTAKAGALKTASALYDIAGSEAQFNTAMASLQRGEDPSKDTVIAGLSSDNLAIQKLATEKMMSIFKASPNFTQPAQRVAGNNTTDGNGVPPSAVVEPITQRQYADGLAALRKSGEWDGGAYTGKALELAKRMSAMLKNS